MGSNVLQVSAEVVTLSGVLELDEELPWSADIVARSGEEWVEIYSLSFRRLMTSGNNS